MSPLSQPAALVVPSPCREGRQPATRRLVAASALAVALMLVVAGCGSSADPESWEEAEEHGFTDPDSGGSYGSAVEFNFIAACLLANDQDSGGNLNNAEAQVLCQCAFDDLRQALTFQEFKDLDKALRENPNPSDLDEDPEDVWDDRAEEILEACVDA